MRGRRQRADEPRSPSPPLRGRAATRSSPAAIGPQRFEDVVGQDHVVQALRNAIRMNRVTHAYLFSGTRGVGKTSIARIFAKCLNCVHGPTDEPCIDVRHLPGDRRRAGRRRHRDRRRQQQRRRGGPRAPPERRPPAEPGAVQDLLHRRSPHALHRRLQRPAEDAGGAARARQVLLRHDRAEQDPDHRPVALPAVRLRRDHARADRRDPGSRSAAARESRPSPRRCGRSPAAPAGSMRDAQSLLEQLLSSGERALTVERVHAAARHRQRRADARPDRRPGRPRRRRGAAAAGRGGRRGGPAGRPARRLARIPPRRDGARRRGRGDACWPPRPGSSRGSRRSSSAGRSTRCSPPCRSWPRPGPAAGQPARPAARRDGPGAGRPAREPGRARRPGRSARRARIRSAAAGRLPRRRRRREKKASRRPAAGPRRPLTSRRPRPAPSGTATADCRRSSSRRSARLWPDADQEGGRPDRSRPDAVSSPSSLALAGPNLLVIRLAAGYNWVADECDAPEAQAQIETELAEASGPAADAPVRARRRAGRRKRPRDSARPARSAPRRRTTWTATRWSRRSSRCSRPVPSTWRPRKSPRRRH